MPSYAISAHGSLVSIGAIGGGGPYTAIGELGDIEGFDMSRNMHEAPRQTSSFISKVPGMADPGTLSFKINYLPNDTHPTAGAVGTGHDVLEDAFKNGEIRGWQLTFSNGVSWTADGVVSGLKPTEPVDGLLAADVTVTLIDAPTLA